jgi:hypothetical protein
MSSTPPINEKHLRIWQQNVHKSDVCQHHVLANLKPSEWDVIILQEPYIDTYGNSRANIHWRLIQPAARYANQSDTIRSIILISAALNTDDWQELPMPDTNNDLTTVQFRGAFGRLTIFNIYNDCTHPRSLAHLSDFLKNNKQDFYALENDYIMVAGDFNRHHPLWEDSGTNAHMLSPRALEDAQPILDLLADYDLDMLLPAGTPTIQRADGGWSRPDNVFGSTNLLEMLIKCDTEPDHRSPRGDHLPISTVFDLTIQHINHSPTRNFRETDWKKFGKELARQLRTIPPPVEITDAEHLNTAVDGLTSALSLTIQMSATTISDCHSMYRARAAAYIGVEV